MKREEEEEAGANDNATGSSLPDDVYIHTMR